MIICFTQHNLFFILLTIALMCSSTFLAYSQQNSVKELAKIDAQRDANKDENKYPLLSVICCSGLSAGFGSLAGIRVGSALPQTGGGGSFGYGPSYQQFWGCCIGVSVCSLLPFIYAYNNVQDPPPERFLGRTPEYIELYTIAYKKSVQKKWLNSTIRGLGLF